MKLVQRYTVVQAQIFKLDARSAGQITQITRVVLPVGLDYHGDFSGLGIFYSIKK